MVCLQRLLLRVPMMIWLLQMLRHWLSWCQLGQDTVCHAARMLLLLLLLLLTMLLLLLLLPLLLSLLGEQLLALLVMRHLLGRQQDVLLLTRRWGRLRGAGRRGHRAMCLRRCGSLAGHPSLPLDRCQRLLAAARLLCARLCQGGLLGAVLHQEVLPLLWAQLRPALLPLLMQRLGLSSDHNIDHGDDAPTAATHETCR